jgi:hypothetical protein
VVTIVSTVRAILVIGLLLLVSISAQAPSVSAHDDGPFGEPEGPIPFPIHNISASETEDHSPRVFAGTDALRVLWNKGFHENFEHQVTHREFDGSEWRPGDDWISVPDVGFQIGGIDVHDAHEAISVEHEGLVYFIFATDDPDQTEGLDHDIVMRTMDPATRSWGPIVDLTPGDEGQDRHPAAAVMDGELVIAWGTTDPGKVESGDEDIVMATLDGDTLSEVVLVSGLGETAKDWQVDMGVVDGVLAFTWAASNLTVRPDDHDILYREWDGSSFLTPPHLVSVAPERIDRFPQVAQVGTDPFIVWESAPPSSSSGSVDIQGRVRTAAGFGPLVHVTDPGGSSSNIKPDTVSHNGMTYILWATDDDSLSFGSDFDIVTRSYDGETLSELVEITHPRDGDIVDGGVSATLFKGNIYAVWNIFFPPDENHDHPDEEVAFRRITDYTAHIQVVDTEQERTVGDTLEVRINVLDFGGESVELDPDFTIHVFRGNEPISSDLVLGPSDEPGWYDTTFRPEKPGSYTLILAHEGRELVSLETLVVAVDEGGGEDRTLVYPLIIALVVVGMAFALVVVTRRRDYGK